MLCSGDVDLLLSPLGMDSEIILLAVELYSSCSETGQIVEPCGMAGWCCYLSRRAVMLYMPPR
jgi:hypothetical protein